MSAIVELRDVTRRFGNVTAPDGVSLGITRGEFFSLLGPSGCGKTTLLRIVAGLDFPDAGEVHLNGNDALSTPAHLRPVNTVFQSYALFPHMTVQDNVAFGLRMKKLPRAEIDARVAKGMELTRISELAARNPTQISGGQKQRVALARALVNEPSVLLLDEPLGALDLKLRKELQHELRALQRRTGVTFIYVTHDQDEALSMSDRIAVMDHGRIIQLGSPAELYERPNNRFVAQFLGGCNLLRAQVRRRDGEEIIAQTALGELRVATTDARDKFTLAIRPEKILFVSNDAINSFAAEIVATTYAGAETHCVVRIDTETLRIATANTQMAGKRNVGDRLTIALPKESLIVLED